MFGLSFLFSYLQVNLGVLGLFTMLYDISSNLNLFNLSLFLPLNKPNISFKGLIIMIKNSFIYKETNVGNMKMLSKPTQIGKITSLFFDTQGNSSTNAPTNNSTLIPASNPALNTASNTTLNPASNQNAVTT